RVVGGGRGQQHRVVGEGRGRQHRVVDRGHGVVGRGGGRREDRRLIRRSVWWSAVRSGRTNVPGRDRHEPPGAAEGPPPRPQPLPVARRGGGGLRREGLPRDDPEGDRRARRVLGGIRVLVLREQ